MLCHCFGPKGGKQLVFSLASTATCAMEYVSHQRAMEIATQGHTGTCNGQGFKSKAYHGYIQDNEGCLVPLRCACCNLQCELCKEWCLRYVRTMLNQSTRPPTKAPPMEPYYVQGILAAFCVLHFVWKHLSNICLGNMFLSHMGSDFPK